MPANLIIRTVLEMSNDIDVDDRQNQVTNPWYLDYEVVGIPIPTPKEYTRIIKVKLLPYETITGQLPERCVLNDSGTKYVLPVTDLKANAPGNIVSLTATEDEFNNAIAGVSGNIGSLLVTKLVTWLTGVFGANYATVKTYQIDITDPDNPIVSDITP